MASTDRTPKTGMYIAVIIISFGIYISYDFNIYTPFKEYGATIQSIASTVGLIAIVLLLNAILLGWIDKADTLHVNRYNLRRVIRLVTVSIVLIILISTLFRQPYSALAGLGVISLILGFALQSPITSFIAWLYIIFRKPYQVGDRVQIGDEKGDVIEISYLDTIIKEVRGDYIGNDRNSGRIIYFPNSLILSGKVINYSGQFVPFIWDETAVQISYTSDLKFVEESLLKATIQDFKEQYPERDIKEHEPIVYFRVNVYAWLEAVISYPVEPTDTTGRRNRILQTALSLLNAEPNKVGFPEGTRR
ncbi:MAG: mechanosensitive ion channel domain-containing protein [Brumimicrobium sp.]